jgi:hypothetical protein
MVRSGVMMAIMSLFGHIAGRSNVFHGGSFFRTWSLVISSEDILAAIVPRLMELYLSESVAGSGDVRDERSLHRWHG